jgi:hypothetical protein
VKLTTHLHLVPRSRKAELYVRPPIRLLAYCNFPFFLKKSTSNSSIINSKSAVTVKCLKAFAKETRYYRMFWKVLFAYFPLIHELHRERSLQHLFVAAGASLPSCYLATIGVYIDTQTQASNNSSTVACIRCSGNVHTESLLSNERRDTLCLATIGGIHIQTCKLIRRIYGVSR